VLEDGKSLREAAKELGVDPVTVRNDVLNNFVMTKKFNTPRKRILYQISQYTKPATAAESLRCYRKIES